MMKIIFTILPAVFFAFFLNSCDDNSDKETVHGSGNLISEQREMSGFDRIMLAGTGNLRLNQTDSEGCTITTDDNIMPLMITKVENGVLIIKPEDDTSIDPTLLDVYVNFIDLTNVEVAGSGNIYTESTLTLNEIAFVITGSGNVSVTDLEAEKTIGHIIGSGNMKFYGNSTIVEAIIDGSGNVDMIELMAEEALARINGSGNIYVYSTRKLDAIIMGSGNIYYKGDPPDLNTQVIGSGSVIKMN